MSQQLQSAAISNPYSRHHPSNQRSNHHRQGNANFSPTQEAGAEVAAVAGAVTPSSTSVRTSYVQAAPTLLSDENLDDTNNSSPQVISINDNESGNGSRRSNNAAPATSELSSRAASTNANWSRAVILFNNMMSSDAVDDPFDSFDDLKDDDVEGDNLKFILVEFARRLVKNPPVHANTDKPLVVRTVKQYFSSMKSVFQNRWPDNTCWKEQEWHSQLLADLDKLLLRHSINNGDGTGRQSVCQPVYRKNNWLLSGDHGSSGKDGSCVDLIHVCKELLRRCASEGTGMMAERCYILFTYLADARGGEVKFLRYNNWIWDPRLLLLELRWSELKTIQEHWLTFVCDADSYACDIFHALGCFYAIDNGLFRASTKIGHQESFVFQTLRQRKDQWVATRMTTLLRQSIPAEQSHLKATVSSRSLRKGATTEMATHSDVTLPQILMRGGWSSGTNMDPYRICTTAGTLPGAKALAGWKDAKADVFPPMLSALGEQNRAEFERYMHALYSTNNLPWFQEGASLWPLLQTCTASLIMYLSDFARDFKLSHPLVQKMHTAAEKTFGGAGGVAKLMEWSRTLKVHFTTLNNNVSASDGSAQESYNAMVKENRELKGLILQMGTRLSDVESLCHHIIDKLPAKRCSCNERLEETHHKPRSPKRHCARNNTIEIDDNDTDDEDMENDSEVDELELEVVGTKKPSPTNTKAAPKQASKQPTAFDELLRKGSSAVVLSKSKINKNDRLLVDVIIKLYHSKQFRQGKQWTNTTNPNHLWDFKEDARYKRSMEFVEKQATPAEIESLNGKGLDEKRLRTIAENLEARCAKTLNELENKKSTDKSSRQKLTYLSISSRVVDIFGEGGQKTNVRGSQSSSKKRGKTGGKKGAKRG